MEKKAHLEWEWDWVEKREAFSLVRVVPLFWVIVCVTLERRG